MRLFTRSLAVTAAAMALAFGTTVPAGAATTVLTAGHVDIIDVDYAAGTLSAQLHDGTTGTAVRRDPATVELDVLAAAKTTVPANSAYSFLGAPGSTVWILPQTQNANLLWPGWNSTDVASGVFQNNSLTLSLIGVTGGQLSIYTQSLSTPAVLFNSGDGLPDSRPLAAGAHTHANWAFGAAGTYTATFRVSGVLAATGATVSADATYTFKVLP
ncbi:choice-of-anchor M domain-containing protein [Amycolatopsis sp. MtRt-6]|uniref:choice-of-anchor M domain-containing protein n=1 Tax=Amycolatopsis sp. MtRt-6 TaxID=2792782 RepID=UPI001A8DD6F1|nr:choice-of-anchor M domain-containing protein [Amycolatopsis sp. MtRt-6]